MIDRGLMVAQEQPVAQPVEKVLVAVAIYVAMHYAGSHAAIAAMMEKWAPTTSTT